MIALVILEDAHEHTWRWVQERRRWECDCGESIAPLGEGFQTRRGHEPV